MKSSSSWKTSPHPTPQPDDPRPSDQPDGDVREPPLPDAGSKRDLPGSDDLIDPETGGGRIKKSG